MKTKTLVLAAAALTACAVTASAQSNVYSLNIVGYVNVVLQPGYNLVANPLDNGAGNVSSNLVPSLAQGMTVGSQVLVYNPGAGYATASALKGSGAWTPVYTIPPGTGYFVRNAGANPITNTYVGSVVANKTNSIAAGYNLVGSVFPVGVVSTNMGSNSLNFADSLVPGSQVLVYNNPGGYATASAKKGSGAWSPVYTINAGQGFFLRSASNAPVQWIQNLSTP